MPIYEYRCPSCESKFEMRRGMSQADDPAACPSCQRTESKRCLSTFCRHQQGERRVQRAGGRHGRGLRRLQRRQLRVVQALGRAGCAQREGA